MTDEMEVDAEASVELDETTRIALDAYREARNRIDEANELRDKARAEVIAFLATRDAKVGTIGGRPACALTAYDQERLDTTRLREEEPATYRRFAKLTHVEQLRLRGMWR